MNREIKFRAWDKSHNPKKLHQIGLCDCCNDLEDVLHMLNHQMPLMQFTGLLDKNGKEIYEGDILKYNATPYDNGGVTSVKYDAPNFISSDGKSLFPFGTLRKEKTIRDAEIIGNIFESPELLKE